MSKSIPDPFYLGPGDDYWWDLVLYWLRQQGADQAVSQLNSRPAGSVLNEVMKMGSIDVGGGCKLVKCPEKSKPAACFVFADPRDGKHGKMCSGNAILQRKKKSLNPFTDDKIEYRTKNHIYASCSYIPQDLKHYTEGEAFFNYDQFERMMYRELKKHPDYK